MGSFVRDVFEGVGALFYALTVAGLSLCLAIAIIIGTVWVCLQIF